MLNKKGQEIAPGWVEFIPWLIALVVLALVVVGYLILSGKAGGALDALKNIFRFGQ